MMRREKVLCSHVFQPGSSFGFQEYPLNIIRSVPWSTWGLVLGIFGLHLGLFSLRFQDFRSVTAAARSVVRFAMLSQ